MSIDSEITLLMPAEDGRLGRDMTSRGKLGRDDAIGNVICHVARIKNTFRL